MSAEEQARAEGLLPVISASLRAEANKAGWDLDQMIAQNPDLRRVAASVTVDVVMTFTTSGQASIACSDFLYQGTHILLLFLSNHIPHCLICGWLLRNLKPVISKMLEPSKLPWTSYHARRLFIKSNLATHFASEQKSMRFIVLGYNLRGAKLVLKAD